MAWAPALRSAVGQIGKTAILALLLFVSPAQAQVTQALMMPDSTNNRVALFDPFSGALLNSNYFSVPGGTTPVHAMQVGNEIWISEQLGDRISRYDLTGAPLGQIGGGPTGGMDNLRGMAFINNTVFLCNDGTGNTAPGPSLLMFNTSGGSLGSFPTTATSGPFGILSHVGSLLVSSDAANDDIHRYSTTGTSLGTFHNSTSLNFAEQMDIAPNGDVLVSAFSSNIVARLDPSTGAILSSFAASGARGLAQLGNGNIMWTNSAGVHVFDVVAGTSSLVYAGGGRFLSPLVVPEPSSLALLGVGAIAWGYRFRARARNRKS